MHHLDELMNSPHPIVDQVLSELSRYDPDSPASMESSPSPNGIVAHRNRRSNRRSSGDRRLRRRRRVVVSLLMCTSIHRDRTRTVRTPVHPLPPSGIAAHARLSLFNDLLGGAPLAPPVSRRG